MIGDRITLNNYSFRETLHGPMMMGTCNDCGIQVAVVAPTDRVNASGLKEDIFTGNPRCTTCGRRHYGLMP
jgi:hypothetical protein